MRRPPRLPAVLLGVLLPGWLALGAKARDRGEESNFVQTGAVITKFAVPQFDPAGRLAGRLRGATGVVLGGERYRVTEVHYIGYTNGVAGFEFRTGECTFNKRDSTVETTNDVVLAHRDFSARGTGMRWNLRENRGTLLSNVTMVFPTPSAQPTP
jgi:hypothetical protein